MKRDSKAGKFLSVVVTLAMVVSLNAPISAWAVEGDGGDEGSASSAQPSGGDGGNESQGEGLTLQDSTSVAVVDDVPYKTLQEAIDAAGDNATVVLTSNTWESVTVEKEKSITLDLGEYTLTAADGNAVTNDGTLTVTATSGGVVSSTQGKTALTNNGTAVIQNGAFSFVPASGANDYYVIENHGDLSISGGTFTNPGNPSSCVRNGWDMPKDVPSGASEAKLTISGGIFTGGSSTIKNDYHSYLNISEGTFTNTYAGEGDDGGCAVLNYTFAEISGGTFTSAYNGIKSKRFDDPPTEGKLVVTGGMVNVTDEYNFSNSGIRVEGGVAEISGVTISSTSSELQANGICLTDSATATIKDTSIQSINRGVQIGDQYASASCAIGRSSVDVSGTAVYAYNGNVKLDSGEYKGDIAVQGYGDLADIVVNGGEFVGGRALHVNQGVASVHGGTFTGVQSGGKQKLYGGTFVNADNDLSGLAADGFVAQSIASANGETTYVVVGNENVAEVDNVTYNTLSAAIDAASKVAGAEIVLQKGVMESVTIPKGANITLNLNGKTITNEAGNDTITVDLDATLTVGGEGTVDNVSHQRAAIYNNGTANLSGGSYTRSAEASTSTEDANGNSYYNILNHGEMVINESVSVVSSGAFSSLIDNGYYSYSSSNERVGYVEGVNQAAPVLTINGGVFSGGINTVKNDDNATVIINSGAFSNVTQAVLFNCNKAFVNGGTFNAASAKFAISNESYNEGVNIVETVITKGTFNGLVSNAALAKMKISGGTFTSTVHSANSDNIDISGGTYSNSVPTEYCAEGFEPVNNADGTYGVAVASLVEMTVGEFTRQYSDLAAFANDLKSATGKISVKLLADVLEIPGTVKISEGQIVDFDLNGHTLSTSLEQSGRHYYAIDNYGTLTIDDRSSGQGGSIVARGVENYGVMTMAGGAIKSCDSNGGGAAVWNEGVFSMADGSLSFTGKDHDNNAGSPFTNASSSAKATITGGSLESPYTSIFVNAGEVVVENVTLSTTTDYWMAVKVLDAGTATLRNVTINADRGGCLENAGGQVTLEDCAFTQTTAGNPAHVSSAVSVSSGGIVLVESGTYRASSFGAYVFNSGGTIDIKGGTFDAPTVLKADDSVDSSHSSIINVSGGEFKGEHVIGNASTLSVSGGQFNTPVAPEYCADGYVPVDGENGQYTVKPKEDVAQIYGNSLNLEGKIGIYYYLSLPKSVVNDAGAYVQFTFNGKVSNAYVKDAEIKESETDGKKYYRFSFLTVAKEMSDTVTMRLFDGKGNPVTLLNSADEDVTDGYEYSVVRYAQTVLSGNYDEKLKSLVKTMLNYGGYAQVHFGHNTGNLASEGVDCSGEMNLVTASVLLNYAPQISDSTMSGLSYYGSSLMLKTDTAIRHYFKIDDVTNMGGYSFKLGETELTPVVLTDGSYCYVEISNIPAKDLDQAYILTIKDDQGNQQTVEYSAWSYIQRVLDMPNASADLTNVSKALYLYADAANEYFAK